MANANWSYPTSMRFGPGRITELAEVCAGAGIKSPLVVTDPGMMKLPVAEAVDEICKRAGLYVGFFSEVQPNPVGSNIEAGVDHFRSRGHDGVIALGGGSALDVGKIVALMAGQHRPVWDFEDIGDNWTRADPTTIAPVIAVPTTAGTGSEVGRAGVVIDEDTHRKVIVFHPKMLPAEVICDPELTVGLPRDLTVGTGIDALSHSLEALCAPSYHPMSHGIGLEGVRLVLDNLPRVVSDPGNIEARGHMMTAAAMGAVAFQKGLGAMHALAHPIGAVFNTHHGMTNAVVMPYVLAANRPAIETVIESLANYTGIEGGFDGFLDRILEMRSAMDVPHTLVELGVDTDSGDIIAAGAIADPSAGGNPIEFTREFATLIFNAACTGDVDGAAERMIT